jgi:hypothetical protein
MKASRSALVVVLGIAAGAPCAETGTVAAQVAHTDITDPASPGACRAAIARLENLLNEALVNGRGVATAPVSVGAMLHHQPTRDSVSKAQRESVMRFESALAAARKLRSEGKRSECISMLEKVALSVGIR